MVVAIIPARYGSTRFEGKPLVNIHGRSMIEHVYLRAKKANRVDNVIVATDDRRIYEEVEGFNGEAMMTSPNHKSGTDRIAEVVSSLENVNIVVNVQGDEPLIKPEMIDSLVDSLTEQSYIPMSTMAYQLKEKSEFNDPNVVKVVFDNDNNALYFSRSPIPYFRDAEFGEVDVYKHLGIYGFKRDFLLEYANMKTTDLEKTESLEQLRAVENGYDIKVVETDNDTIGVDTPDDLEKVRGVMSDEEVDID